MASAKVAITMDSTLLKRVDGLVRKKRFANRSQAIQMAVRENLIRWDRRNLEDELLKLDPEEEKAFAEENFEGEKTWPEY
ncbi:MAG: ribbon-helix-helix domain-containing protein [Deltaproteobacteria bacterium]|nr:ribbon-helix-helix domain-containing protein [Deltaproteobacteria bacterium]